MLNMMHENLLQTFCGFNCEIYSIETAKFQLKLPPSQVMFSQVSVHSQGGTPVPGSFPGVWAGTGVPPPPHRLRLRYPPSPRQYRRASTCLCSGEYASCCHAGGLSCYVVLLTSVMCTFQQT